MLSKVWLETGVDEPDKMIISGDLNPALSLSFKNKNESPGMREIKLKSSARNKVNAWLGEIAYAKDYELLKDYGIPHSSCSLNTPKEVDLDIDRDSCFMGVPMYIKSDKTERTLGVNILFSGDFEDGKCKFSNFSVLLPFKQGENIWNMCGTIGNKLRTRILLESMKSL